MAEAVRRTLATVDDRPTDDEDSARIVSEGAEMATYMSRVSGRAAAHVPRWLEAG